MIAGLRHNQHCPTGQRPQHSNESSQTRTVHHASSDRIVTSRKQAAAMDAFCFNPEDGSIQRMLCLAELWALFLMVTSHCFWDMDTQNDKNNHHHESEESQVFNLVAKHALEVQHDRVQPLRTLYQPWGPVVRHTTNTNSQYRELGRVGDKLVLWYLLKLSVFRCPGAIVQRNLTEI